MSGHPLTFSNSIALWFLPILLVNVIKPTFMLFAVEFNTLCWIFYNCLFCVKKKVNKSEMQTLPMTSSLFGFMFSLLALFLHKFWVLRSPCNIICKSSSRRFSYGSCIFCLSFKQPSSVGMWWKSSSPVPLSPSLCCLRVHQATQATAAVLTYCVAL